MINDRYVHVGDNLMAADDGTPLLPWAELEYVGDHIRSLQLLQELRPPVLLLSHGPSISGEPAISEAIDDRLRYLQAVWETQGAISFEQATAHCSCRFLGERWHIRSADQS
jgi:glyoxylase-like metal-dependent hydrolase (beta-lactamase superfamily II)